MNNSEKPGLAETFIYGAEAAINLLHPNMFNMLDDDQKNLLLETCGADPTNPNAYHHAIQNVNLQLRRMRSAFDRRLFK